MARQVVVSLGGAVSTFDMSKVDRTKLYGRKRRVPLDPKGEPCSRGALTEDGSLLVRSGMTAQGYFDSDQHWIPNKDLVGLDIDGKPVEKVDSTLGKEQALEPATATEVLDSKVLSVYALEPADLDDALKEKLLAGELFAFKFNYRADYQAERAFLIASDDEDFFAVIGRPSPPEWLEAEEIAPPVFDDDDDDDDLDFEMF